MQASQTPTLVPLAFAANGTKNTIPEASQIGVTPGAASLNDGFPPLTFTPVAAGGVPPAGADFNGVLNLITQSIRWAHGGGRYAFSSTFAADANVSGYPAGAELMSADFQGAWLSLNDANTDNPDTGPGTKWVPSRAYGVTSVTGLTNANVTLTPAQAAKNRITLAGTLTGNVQIIFPTWLREWTIINNTTGAFTVTAKTAAGTGVAIPQDASPTKVTGDGTNITQLAENVAPATQSQHAVQLGQAKGRLLNLVTITSSGSYTPSSSLVTAIMIEVVGGGGAGGGAPVTNASQVGVGAGGNAGAFARALVPLAGLTLPATVTIGAGGVGGTGTGPTGGNSIFNAGSVVVTANGGVGGQSAGLVAPPLIVGNGTPSTASGGVLNVPGSVATVGAVLALTNGYSGQGASSIYGSGGGAQNNTGNGVAAGGFGSGGSGALALASNGSARSGGNGTLGAVFVYEYS